MRQLPAPLPVLGPAALAVDASADTRATVLGHGLTACASLHGAIESSGNVDLAGAGDGDGSVSLDGADPLGFVHLDEDLALSGGAGLARPAPPGAGQVVRRCTADETAPGSAVPSTMSPAQIAAVPADIAAATAGAVAAPSAEVSAPGQPATAEASAEAGPGVQDDAADPATPGDLPAAQGAAGKSIEALPPALGPAPWGVVIGVLGAVAVALVVPSAVSFAWHNRRGANWVRANVQTVAQAAPAAGIATTPETDWPGLPTFGVQLALRADGGTQSVTEVAQ